MSSIKELYFQQIERQYTHNESLAAEFWPGSEPVMAIPVAHFSGVYPPAPTGPKVCKVRGYITGVGETAVKLIRAEFSQWRGYTHQKSGRYIQPCQHCRHERVLTTCEHIERASFQYANENFMRWQSVTKTEKNQLTAALRKRRERGTPISYTSFPLSNGRFILLHDAPDVGGQTLPVDRRELYHLVAGWVLDTPKGKRAAKGLSTWGKPQDKPEKQQAGPKKRATEEAGKRWRLIVESYSAVLRELMAYEGEPIKNGRFKIPVGELIDRLDAAGVAWAVESGELPVDVTLNRENNTPISVKCDAAGEEGQREEKAADDLPPEPAPIWLNGGWVR